MKNNFFRFGFLLLLVLSITFSLASCKEKSNKNSGPIVNPITVNFSIDYPNKSKLDDIEFTPFTCEEDSTLIDITQLYCNVNDIPVGIETTFGDIIAINNIISGHYDKEREWICLINGEVVDSSLYDVHPEDGDNIQWFFKTIEK